MWYTRLARWCATGFGVGLLPAPGTMGTLLIGLPVVCLWHRYMPRDVRPIVGLTVATLVVVAVVAVATHEYAVHGYPAQKDPQEIVLDEVIGVAWALVGFGLSPQRIIVGTLLFRFFDITKLGFIGACERLPGAWGIVMDDVAAGIVTRIILYILISVSFL